MTLAESSSLASWAQALIYLITLIVLYRQLKFLRTQTETQTNALKEQIKNAKYSEYVRCKIDFSHSMNQLIRNNMHDDIYSNIFKIDKEKFNTPWDTYSVEEKKVYAYFEILYELFVRVYLSKEENIITLKEWGNWEAWIDDIIKHPVFNDVHIDSIGMYSEPFQEFITQRLKAVNNYKNNRQNPVA